MTQQHNCRWKTGQGFLATRTTGVPLTSPTSLYTLALIFPHWLMFESKVLRHHPNCSTANSFQSILLLWVGSLQKKAQPIPSWSCFQHSLLLKSLDVVVAWLQCTGEALFLPGVLYPVADAGRLPAQRPSWPSVDEMRRVKNYLSAANLCSLLDSTAARSQVSV